jgi:hypothetical protein
MGKIVWKSVTALCLLFVAISPALAEDVVSGKVRMVEGVGSGGSAPGNYDFRVYLQDQSTICAGAIDPGWGYINLTDANYKVLVSMVMMAQATGKTLTLYSKKSDSGYCQIDWLYVE